MRQREGGEVGEGWIEKGKEREEKENVGERKRGERGDGKMKRKGVTGGWGRRLRESGGKWVKDKKRERKKERGKRKRKKRGGRGTGRGRASYNNL